MILFFVFFEPSFYPMNEAFVCAIHGAGGGAWEYERFWSSCFQEANLTLSSITLEPCDQGIEFSSLEHYIQQVITFVSERANDTKQPIVLIGASMGALIAMKVVETGHFNVCALVLICPVSPQLETSAHTTFPIASEKLQEPYPPIIRWANSPLQETVDSMPDATEEVCSFAAERWRDESGLVLNTILSGVPCKRPICSTLVVVPNADTTVSPASQKCLAEYLSASVCEYEGMSHVGPLLGVRAPQVAGDVIRWLNSTCNRI